MISLRENMEHINAIPSPPKDDDVTMAFFERYKELGGAVPDFETFERHLHVFVMLTRDAFVFGMSPLSRDEAFEAWRAYCAGMKLGKKEPGLFFTAVDSVHAYT
jgi:hypothetical protein